MSYLWQYFLIYQGFIAGNTGCTDQLFPTFQAPLGGAWEGRPRTERCSKLGSKLVNVNRPSLKDRGMIFTLMYLIFPV
ncbi:hypothetical protein QV09_00990 [Gallibacterium salpingitidis]|uniref:Uncharacterized protein n=1 Tax=Gallibacterium salpingitidis TaxID=505341 RepID=A0AB36E522_9PAST|nr:hypothetical protein QV09_00990 [Gallibacterium salpingitidis]